MGAAEAVGAGGVTHLGDQGDFLTDFALTDVQKAQGQRCKAGR